MSNPNMRRNITQKPGPVYDEGELTSEQQRIYEYEHQLYEELVSGQKKPENKERMRRYANRKLEFWLEFLAHPERFRPTRMAQIDAAGKVLKRLQDDAYEASLTDSPEAQEVARKIADLEEKIQKEILAGLPGWRRKNLMLRGFSRITGVLGWVESLVSIDDDLRGAGEPGVVEIIHKYVAHSVDISVRWGREQPILEQTYSMKLPYNRTRGGFIWGEGTETYTRGSIAFDLTDWVERIPDEELSDS